KAFVTSQSAIQHFTYVYDYRTKNACGNQYGGLCNTKYIKLGANADLMKDLNGDLGVYYLRADKRFNGVAGLAGVTTDSKDLGWEIDASVKYKIDRNLTYWVEGGYLFAGDFWKSVTAGRNPDDAYSVRHGISLSF
ncbi:MAG TPA: alginate export family protein, partial [Thermodesulfovibrionales bacterium]|nr:alginate export family protein [Thermodesulfovibrionales bacterium]